MYLDCGSLVRTDSFDPWRVLPFCNVGVDRKT